MIPQPQILGLTLLLVLGGCAYPVATTEQGGPASGLYFPGAAAGATVSVDGALVGDAATFDGRKALLTVKPGPHRVRVQAGATIFYDQSVYVGPGARLAIKVN